MRREPTTQRAVAGSGLLKLKQALPMDATGETLVRMTWQDALAARRRGIAAAKFPSKGDDRATRPSVAPRFSFEKGISVFTLGSCFARNIERKLTEFDIPTLRFSTPVSEAPHSSNTLLNEYNPGTIAQRITFALQGKDYPDDTIVPAKNGYLDLSLPGGFPVAFERAKERRRAIMSVYSELRKCKIVIITLGFVEAWYDRQTCLYLNQIPPPDVLRSSDRFEFHRMGFDDAILLLEPAIASLLSAGPKVLLTVSPVPIGSTFSGLDAVVANEYSKSVLRTCADALYRSHPTLDYFPSYEIVRLMGESAYDEDNIHVRSDVVAKITDYMVELYTKPEAQLLATA